MSNSFNTKVIIMGRFLEKIEYENPIFVGHKRKRIKKKIVEHGFPDIEVKEKNKKRSVNRTKSEFRRLVNSNEQLTKFISPTFDPKKFPDTTDVSVANRLFNKFIMRLNYKYKELQYIAVPEFQKDIDYYGNKKPNGGNIHYHILCNLKYVPISTLSKTWKMGGIDIKRIDRITNVGLYMGKYLSKNYEDERFKNKKKYFTSTNLNKPIELTGIIAHGYMLKHQKEFRLDFVNKYNNEYTGEIVHEFYERV